MPRHYSAGVAVPVEPILEALGARVRGHRTSRGWTLRQLASASGVSERFLSDLEAGRANISVVRLCDVARALQTAAGRLLEGEAKVESEPIVALLGARGAGKSTIGPKLASRCRLPFFELDGLVEADTGLGLSELFALHGEDYYRRSELRVLERFLARSEGAVLATGGGVVHSPEAMRLLRERCVTIWLKAAAEEHWERVVRQGDSRPMRDNPHAMTELRSLLERREPLYAQAQLVVDTGRLGLRGSVDALVQAVRTARPSAVVRPR